MTDGAARRREDRQAAGGVMDADGGSGGWVGRKAGRGGREAEGGGFGRRSLTDDEDGGAGPLYTPLADDDRPEGGGTDGEVGGG